MPVLLQVFDPDDVPPEAGEAVHGRIAAEKDVIAKKGDVVGRMPGSLEDAIGKVQVPEFIRVDGNEPMEEFFPDGRVFVLTLAKESEYLAEQPRQAAGATAYKRVLALFEPVDGFGMKDHLRVRMGQYLIQEAGVVVVGVRQEHKTDLLRPDSRRLQLFPEATESVLIPRVDQDISFPPGNEVIIDDTVAQIDYPVHTSAKIRALPCNLVATVQELSGNMDHIVQKMRIFEAWNICQRNDTTR